MVLRGKGLYDAISDKDNFANDFFTEYFSRGFGSMNKNDIEVLLVHLLQKYNGLTGRAFDKSISLQVSESKVKRLMYEASIVYISGEDEQQENELKKELVEALKTAKVEGSKKDIRIKFIIQNKFVKNKLNDRLISKGYFLDGSFASDVVSISPCDFAELIDSFIPNENKDEIKRKLGNLNLKGSDLLEKLKNGSVIATNIGKIISMLP